MTILKQFILITLSLILCCCSKSPATKNSLEKKYIVQYELLHKNLAFTGNIQPLKENSVTSPIDGVVLTMNYHYGQFVPKDAVIALIHSPELQKQYNEVLTDYLKTKDNFNVTQARFHGTQELWQAGLIAKNNYLSEKSSIDTTRIALIQASNRLKDMLDKVDEPIGDLSNLSLANFDKVKHILAGQHNVLHIKAPAAGILLYPPKANDDKVNHLAAGSAIKTGEVMGIIGDMSGLSIEITVPEVDITKIHPGMKATVTAVALGNLQLDGELVAVNPQATVAGNGLPSFSAIVEVKNLSAEQQNLVKVGMSASIILQLSHDKELLLPLNAIKQEKGATVVKLKKADGSVQLQTIATGMTQNDKVIVLAGLHAGDVVLYE